VEVEQDSAVGRLRHRPEECAVAHLTGERSQVVHPGLEREGHAQPILEPADVGGRALHGLGRLHRGEQKARAKFVVAPTGPIEAQVLAHPGSSERGHGFRERIEMTRVRGLAPPHGEPDAVHQLRLRKARQPLEGQLARTKAGLGGRAREPERLRLDLDHVDAARAGLDPGLEAGKIDDTDSALGQAPGPAPPRPAHVRGA
jgi:hypothetical protein